MDTALIDHYRSLLERHGPSAQALQYSDAATQCARFAVLAGVADPLGSVLDVGCGLAHLHGYLRSAGFAGRYHGVDVVPEFVEHAARALADDPLAGASLADAEEPLPGGFDHVLLSGVFNNRMEDNRGFMEGTLARMFEAAGRGIAFNAMSTHVEYRDPELYYVDPMEVFAFCKETLGGHPVLRHDYVLREGGFPFEFAMYVYKAPSPAA